MKITSAEASKMLRKLEEDKITLEEFERERMRYHAAVSEDANELKPKDYDFVEMQDKMEQIDQKIITLKHAINTFNSRTFVYKDLTIDQALVRLPQLTRRKRKYQSMMNVAPKIRCSIQGNVIDYLYTSYDPKIAEEYYEQVCEEIKEIQTALDKINNNVTFEVAL